MRLKLGKVEKGSIGKLESSLNYIVRSSFQNIKEREKGKGERGRGGRRMRKRSLIQMCILLGGLLELLTHGGASRRSKR